MGRKTPLYVATDAITVDPLAYFFEGLDEDELFEGRVPSVKIKGYMTDTAVKYA